MPSTAGWVETAVVAVKPCHMGRKNKLSEEEKVRADELPSQRVRAGATTAKGAGTYSIS